jgi:polyphosphate glucokinase
VGKATWNRRVVRTIGVLDALLFPDVIYLGGGNARHVEAELPAKVTRIDPNAGILGGLKLWNLAEVG